MKKINEKDYLIIYTINKLTEDYLKHTNDYMKANKDNLSDIFTNGKHDNVDVGERKATDVFSSEDKAKIELYKKQFTPINQGAKTLKIDVKTTKEAEKEATSILETANSKLLKKLLETIE